jgi:hypothetical protein
MYRLPSKLSHSSPYEPPKEKLITVRATAVRGLEKVFFFSPSFLYLDDGNIRM